MKLGSKTFLYSVIISLIMGIVIFSYMIFLMPSMYMDYKGKQNLQNSRTAMEYFKEHESLKSTGIGDSTMLGIVVPKHGYSIKVTGAGFDGHVEFTSPSAKMLIDKIRSVDENDAKNSKALFREFKPVLSSILSENTGEIKKNFKIDINLEGNSAQFEAKGRKLHYFSGGIGIGEFSVQSRYSGTSYTYFVGVTNKGDNTLIMANSVMTPTAKEILPVLYGSMPMLALFMIILAFGVSAIYSKKIVEPIKKLSMDAEKRMYSSSDNLAPLEISGKDEIADLTAALNLLYEKQAQAVNELEEENKRKEVYMRATSHQLKTPIAASMLLVDGMIGNIGKFGNRDIYLPEVKSQLKEMMSIIDETSNINGIADNNEIEPIEMMSLCREIIGKNRINADLKGIAIQLEASGGDICWQSNTMMLKKILENLVTNGINHTKENGSVKVTVEKTRITVFNQPGHIEETIVENIFEPFVTSVEAEGSERNKGHGLGLYIAKYFAGKLGMELSGENVQDGVEFVLEKRGSDD